MTEQLWEGRMPLYEFDCLDCGVSFETLVQKAAEISKVKCPACESQKLEEKVSSFAAVSKAGTSTVSNCAPSGG
jgi:putative FmdB family regulatory protein